MNNLLLPIGVALFIGWSFFDQTVADIKQALEVRLSKFRVLPISEQSWKELRLGIKVQVRNPTAVSFALSDIALRIFLERDGQLVHLGDSPPSSAAIRIAAGADTELEEIRIGLEWAKLPAGISEIIKSGNKQVVVKASFLVNGNPMSDAKTFPLTM